MITGLIALAVSDLLFCMIGAPAAFLTLYTVQPGSKTIIRILVFFYDTFKLPLLNVFLFSSTWLTVAISIER